MPAAIQVTSTKALPGTSCEVSSRLESRRCFPSERAPFARVLGDDFSLLNRREIRSDGYLIDTLEAALWCLLQGGSFSDIVLRAVNLGGDTDTTGCVAGGLAGVLLGADAIPSGWKRALAQEPPLGELIERLVCVCTDGDETRKCR